MEFRKKLDQHTALNDAHLVPPPEPVGSYEIAPRFFFHMPFKPRASHRWFAKLLLGWKWSDIPPTGRKDGY